MPFHYQPGPGVVLPIIPYKARVRLPARRTALIVGDMQNDFVLPGGALRVPSAAATVPRIARLLAAARRAGARVAYTQDTMLEDDPEFPIWGRHCVEGTRGWRILDRLRPRRGELVCPKPRYDGFFGTRLEHILRDVWKIETAVIVGTVSNICVLHTAASAAARLMRLVVPADGISALDEFGQLLALYQISSLYRGDVVRSVDDIRFAA